MAHLHVNSFKFICSFVAFIEMVSISDTIQWIFLSGIESNEFSHFRRLKFLSCLLSTKKFLNDWIQWFQSTSLNYFTFNVSARENSNKLLNESIWFAVGKANCQFCGRCCCGSFDANSGYLPVEKTMRICKIRLLPELL